MAILSVVTPSRSGTTLTLVAAAEAGDSFPNTGREVVYVDCTGSGASRTVTFALTGTADGQSASAGKAVTIGAGLIKICGPFPTELYNDVNSRVVMTYSDEEFVSVGVIARGS